MASVKNLSIGIKVGDKKYILRNLITNNLLNEYANCLDLANYMKASRKLSNCLIKFDDSMQIDQDLDYVNSDFDLAILGDITEQLLSPNRITTKYRYLGDIYDFNTNQGNGKWNNFIGKKITTLGFSSSFANHNSIKIGAILDVSNYDIYVEKNADIIITRIDIVETDTKFTSSNLDVVKGSVHLTVNGIPGLIAKQDFWNEDKTGHRSVYNNTYAKLVSVGLGYTADKIESNYIIENNLGFNITDNVVTITDIEAPYSKGLFPSANLYPNAGLYPQKRSFRFLILRFKLYQMLDKGNYYEENFAETDTGEWYYQAIPLTKFGNIGIKIKYERG